MPRSRSRWLADAPHPPGRHQCFKRVVPPASCSSPAPLARHNSYTLLHHQETLADGDLTLPRFDSHFLYHTLFTAYPSKLQQTVLHDLERATPGPCRPGTDSTTQCTQHFLTFGSAHSTSQPATYYDRWHGLKLICTTSNFFVATKPVAL
ncbi:hypothetical protein L226DRAFT_190031 [Lentinus tigrinus ALCF2SS1-7]|uniref:Uncharacterized protein n=1 Tax=Lentinus tigrinus ALCF2SS1-6 TaxID=1328759 RepID=A0A5C2SQR5_9APHY|nr:hypothetical protein L227DRAFT_134165 [Lentinus tigrinus ALCF2SS1-6]RPD80084.1 hypothetical protein L226DRAFT_190031 [Lentinus tigrinus ALCF2SS1-7]